jgi:hypothetical protein
MQPTNEQVIFALNFVNSAYLMYGQDGTYLTPPAQGFPAGYAVTSYMNTIDPDSGQRVFFGFVAAKPGGPAVLAIRGTYNYSEWFTDFDAFPTAFPPLPGSNVATGFYEFYQNVQFIDPGTMISAAHPAFGSFTDGLLVAGHSLGGAIATLLAADWMSQVPSLDLTLVTAASPAVGDYAFFTDFSALVPNSYRYNNYYDSVANFLNLVYYQVDTEISMYSYEIYPTPECEHSLATYVYLLSPPGTECNFSCCILDEAKKTALRALYARKRSPTA